MVEEKTRKRKREKCTNNKNNLNYKQLQNILISTNKQGTRGMVGSPLHIFDLLPPTPPRFYFSPNLCDT